MFWHWQHFFLPLNKQGVLFSTDKQPLFNIFFIFYKDGLYAVELFFCLSGFIFFWLYSKRITEKTITIKSFSVLRLSRLYPLHFVTLLFVTLGQLVYKSMTNVYFVFQFNDIYHFVLNLFFASYWGLEKGFAFNAPIWSLSVEVLLYAIFFVVCRIFYRNIIVLVFLCIIGDFLEPKFNPAIASGIEFFFLGGITFLAYQEIIKTGDTWKVSIWLPFIVSIAWLLTIWVESPNPYFTVSDLPWPIRTDTLKFLFPLTVLSLVLIETKRETFGRRLSFIGDISYSLYLLHFPLQLTVATIIFKLNIREELFYSAWFMILFFFVLILLSLASHRYFEIPMQHLLRRHFVK